MSAAWRQGGCHCGALRFAVRLPAAPRLLDCNCSVCRRAGFLHLIVGAGDLQVAPGSAAPREYRFGTRTARHLFCGRCGTKPWYVPRSHPQGYSVNARCLDGGPEPGWAVEAYDGRNWEAARAALD